MSALTNKLIHVVETTLDCNSITQLYLYQTGRSDEPRWFVQCRHTYPGDRYEEVWSANLYPEVGDISWTYNYLFRALLTIPARLDQTWAPKRAGALIEAYIRCEMMRLAHELFSAVDIFPVEDIAQRLEWRESERGDAYTLYALALTGELTE